MAPHSKRRHSSRNLEIYGNHLQYFNANKGPGEFTVAPKNEQIILVEVLNEI
jgi:hypothetical protein